MGADDDEPTRGADHLGHGVVGLRTRQHTGWLQDGVYAPHTAGGFKAPANKTLLLLGNGYLARRGLKRAQRARAAAQAGLPPK